MINRRAAAGLAVSSSLLVGIALHEGYTDKAVIPVPGDVPTKGFGTTKGVKMGDKTTPTRALVDLLNELNMHSDAIKKCIHVPLAQYEFDAYSSFSYNVGSGAFCKSTLLKKLNALDYSGACKELLRWDRVGGRVVRGLTIRREAEYKTCMGMT